MAKTNLSELSINQLVQVTGLGYRTIVKKLGAMKPTRTDGRSKFYNPRKALPLIFDATDLEGERARLLSEQADKEAMENARRRGEMLPRGDVVDAVAAGAVACRSRLLSIPTKLAPAIIPGMSLPEIAGIAEELIHEALIELTSIPLGNGGVGGPLPSDPAQKANGQSVG